MSKAVKLRNLGQRERNRLAKAGESDRAIKVKMVGDYEPCADFTNQIASQNIFSLGNGKVAKQTDVSLFVFLFSLLYITLVFRSHVMRIYSTKMYIYSPLKSTRSS